MGLCNNRQQVLSISQRIRAGNGVLQHGPRADEGTVLLWDWPAHPSTYVRPDPLTFSSCQDNGPKPVSLWRRTGIRSCFFTRFPAARPVVRAAGQRVVSAVHSILQQAKKKL
jgi:hypothetical protein